MWPKDGGIVKKIFLEIVIRLGGANKGRKKGGVATRLVFIEKHRGINGQFFLHVGSLQALYNARKLFPFYPTTGCPCMELT